MLATIENKWDLKYIQILPGPNEGATDNIGEGLHYYELTQCKTLHILKTNVFEIPDNKKIGRLI